MSELMGSAEYPLWAFVGGAYFWLQGGDDGLQEAKRADERRQTVTTNTADLASLGDPAMRSANGGALGASRKHRTEEELEDLARWENGCNSFMMDALRKTFQDSEPMLLFNGGKPAIQGALWRKGKSGRRWQRRICFLLSNGMFYYFHLEGDGTPLGCIYLNAEATCQAAQKNGWEFTICTMENVFEFKGETAEEMNRWIDAIEDVLAHLTSDGEMNSEPGSVQGALTRISSSFADMRSSLVDTYLESVIQVLPGK
ncbi:hypothetical protein CYMTET_25078 [Cymbomonas tetramitiformis]|uniref:PH domain-containing protein n=1 Tax=Cymbomonas tetramitiformis TaxID=36881 RepID=A0AAE0KZK9_9CHLO|nr:hypothetical protein CYMTET_25078 [Cymbomonas tetramitiformis]